MSEGWSWGARKLYRCAACRLPLGPGADLSLYVDITEGRDLDGTICIAFDSAVCHLQCQKPGLKVHQTAGYVGEPASVGARLLLGYGGTGQSNIPVLAYTLVRNLVFGKPGGEMTSALVSALLNHGFQMSLSDCYGETVRQACLVRETCTCVIGGSGEVELLVDDTLMHSQQLNRADPEDAMWLEEARAGHVLVISGDNLGFTDTGLELTAAARLGTLVTGAVPVLVASEVEQVSIQSFRPGQDR